MNEDDANLPPTWVAIFSRFFLLFLVMPPIVAWQLLGGTILGTSAFGLRLRGWDDPLPWILAVDLILFLAGLTGLFVVTKRRFAYDFGIFYCVAALVVTIPGHFAVGNWDAGAWLGMGVQYPLLICFLIHLIRNRKRWADQTADYPKRRSEMVDTA